MLKRSFFLILACSIAGALFSQPEEEEAKLKAAFIYNFTRYIEWDNAGEGNDFVIGIIGSTAITPHLQEIAKQYTVKDRKIVIRVFSKPEDIADCSIIFIPQKNPFSLQSILDKTGKGVLTISEEDGFAKRGTAFNFVIKNNKLKFEANLKAIYMADLKAGSQLLKLAIIVD